MRIILLIISICVCMPSWGQPQIVEPYATTDSLDCPPVGNDYRFEPRRLIAPGVMLAAGITGIYAFKGIRRSVCGMVGGNKTIGLDRYFEFVPTVAYLGVGAIPGVISRTDIRQRLLATATTYLIVGATVNAFKHTLHEKRPDGGNGSFPSGHTAFAFAGAELTRIEYGNLIGTASYAVAIATGVLRMHNNRHWINDVVGGAALGILSARIAYWLLPFERKIFRLDNSGNRNRSIAIAPVMFDHGGGLALGVIF